MLVHAEDWPGGAERGRSYILRAADLGSGATIDTSESQLVAQGASDDFSFGYLAVPVGDFDRDGRDDIAVAAYGTSFGGVAAGSVFLLPVPY